MLKCVNMVFKNYALEHTHIASMRKKMENSKRPDAFFKSRRRSAYAERRPLIRIKDYKGTRTLHCLPFTTTIYAGIDRRHNPEQPGIALSEDRECRSGIYKFIVEISV